MTQKEKIDAALEVLNFYRNCNYNAPSGTPEFELANAINDVLPLLAKVKDDPAYMEASHG